MSAVAFPDDFDDFERKHARKSDPSTSKQGARDVAMRAGTQNAKLLLAFAENPNKAMNWSMAMNKARLHVRACAWRRLTDLSEMGLIELVEINGIILKLPGDLGSDQQAYVITDKGRAKARELKNK